MKKYLAMTVLVLFASMAAAQDGRKVGLVDKINGKEVTVKYNNINRPLSVGDKLHISLGTKKIVLEVSFPMQTIAKCQLAAKDAALAKEIKKGCDVFSGDGSSGGVSMTGDKAAKFTLPSGTVFSMRGARVPEKGISFPTGTNDSGVASIKEDFEIAEILTTNSLWTEVCSWAEKNGYVFVDVWKDRVFSDGAFSKSFSADCPVVYVSWREAMVWCNALTEYYNEKCPSGEELECVYYTDAAYKNPIRIITNEPVKTKKGSQDVPYVKADSPGNVDMLLCSASGFRLPSSEEFEYAARYRGSDNTNSLSMNGLFWTKGNSASAAKTSYNDVSDKNPKNGIADGKDAMDAVAVYGFYWKNDFWEKTGVNGPQQVKGKAANTLGLYDMSGNVWEWCFTKMPGDSARVLRGGSFAAMSDSLQVGYYLTGNPDYSCEFYGFRLARNRR